jgi:HNH endonuclease
MPRSLPEWIGLTDDTPVPPRVRLRVLERFGRRCDPARGCGRPLRPGDAWTCDHIEAVINGGANRERNLHPLCEWCEPPKTQADVHENRRGAPCRAHSQAGGSTGWMAGGKGGRQPVSTNTAFREGTSYEQDQITVDAEIDGKPAEEFTFDWEGDREDMQHNMKTIESMAQGAGLNPERFAKSMVLQFPSMGPLQGAGGANQRMAFLYAVLRFTDEHAADFPGPVLDCLARYDFSATLTIRDGAASVEIEGLPWTLH